jgi:hypothetical protein
MVDFDGFSRISLTPRFSGVEKKYEEERTVSTVCLGAQTVETVVRLVTAVPPR